MNESPTITDDHHDMGKETGRKADVADKAAIFLQGGQAVFTLSYLIAMRDVRIESLRGDCVVDLSGAVMAVVPYTTRTRSVRDARYTNRLIFSSVEEVSAAAVAIMFGYAGGDNYTLVSRSPMPYFRVFAHDTRDREYVFGRVVIADGQRIHRRDGRCLWPTGRFECLAIL